ncbi:MAG: PQQ-binding-like beta-propeller repeat protein [Candidatus Hydrogenedentes bacterium]|nr:PQQ-binding-like beta-propeller repeat protein [Candidatus Hydrogenedentota bacterium]
MTVDLDGDGDAEIVTAAYEELIAIDGDGKERWRFDARGRYQTCPAIWERDGAPPLLFAGDNTGQFTCLDGGGKVIWQVDTKPIFCAAPAIGDLDGDGTMEVVQGDKSGMVHAFNALTGKVVWQTQIEGECSSPALADLDGDGKRNVVIATGAGKVFALDAAGAVLWTYAMDGTTPDWATCSPIVFKVGDGKRRIACSSGNETVHCIDAKGKQVWSRTTRGAVASTLSAGDIDDDGWTDLFAVTQLGVVYRFDEDGRTRWQIDSQGRSLAPGALVDIDGDEKLEYVLCTQNGNLIVIDNNGDVAFSYQFKHRTINVTPAFGEIAPEREGIEFVVTGGESGRVICFGAPARVGTRSQWRSYRGDSRLVAAWLPEEQDAVASIAPVDLDADGLVCGDVVRCRVMNHQPERSDLFAEVAIEDPAGEIRSALGRVDGAQTVVELPVSIRQAGTYALKWRVKDGNGFVLACGEQKTDITPFKNDRSLLEMTLLQLRAAVGGARPADDDGSFRAALHSETKEILRVAVPLQTRWGRTNSLAQEDWQDLERDTAELNARCRRAAKFADMVDMGLMKSFKAGLVPFQESDGDSRDLGKRVPQLVFLPYPIKRRCVVGEHEPVSIKLFNASNEALRPSIKVTSASAGIRTQVLAPKEAPTNLGGTAWDALVPSGDAQLEIPPLESREIWLDIDATEAKPGEHRIDVSAQTESGNTEVNVFLDILPFAMAGYDQMRMCAWAKYDEHAVRDLLAHGNTVFIGNLPPATVTDGTSPGIVCDYGPLNGFLAPLKGHDVYLLFHGIPQLGVPMESDEYVPRFAEYMKLVLAHLAANGFDEEHVALYPYDEPGGNGWNVVKQYTAFAQQALKALPTLRFYVNGGADLPKFEEMAEYAGIWSPGIYMLPERSPEMELLRKTGKPLWSYDCAYLFSRPIGANTKTVNVVAQYRLSAIIAMNYGATGIGWWCYNHGPSMWDPIPFEYPLVYTNEDGTVTTSRRWEAVREGVEDARILIALRERLGDDSVSGEAKEKIRHLLEKTVPELSKQTMEYARLGVARYVIDETHNDELVERLRAEMMNCVAAVGR